MRIAIITLCSSQDNYGQLFQAYALQKHLQNFGHEVFFINYIMGKLSFKEQIKFLFKYPKHRILHLTKKLFKLGINKDDDFQKRYSRDFDSFKKTYLMFSKKYTTIYELKENPPIADVYITGSDQVWNMDCFENAKAYFLDFAPLDAKRISYAASFGKNNLSKSFLKFIAPMLHKFSVISVREKKGIEFCTSIGILSAEEVVDPTMLLSFNDYLNISSSSFIWQSDKQKVLCYFLNFKKKEDVYWNEILNVVKLNDLNSKIVVSSGKESARDILDADYFSPNPSEFLSAINQTDYVITNSFHGTVFAILMKKKFVTILLPSGSGMNDRVYSLLSKLNLLDSIYDPSKNIWDLLNRPINWNHVDAVLEEWRTYSANWLKNALEK